MVEEQFPQRRRAFVGVDAAGHDHAQPAVRPQQGMVELQEHLVGVQVGRALVQERVRRIGKALALAALRLPLRVQPV